MKKFLLSTTTGLTLAATLLGLQPALAADSTTITITLQAARTKADAQIDARIKALNALYTRVNAMTRLTDDQQNALAATVNANIAEMTTLKAKIDADTDAATLREDMASITKSYRIYLLIMPQAAIEAAADRVLDVASDLTTFAAKLQARIDAAKTAGADVSAMVTAKTDMDAKLADATTQANAAVSEVMNLKPDNGDVDIFRANLASLKDARSKVVAGIHDIGQARNDAGTIVKALVTWDKAHPDAAPKSDDSMKMDQ